MSTSGVPRSPVGLPQYKKGMGVVVEVWQRPENHLDVGWSKSLINKGCALSPLIYTDVGGALLLKNPKQTMKTQFNQKTKTSQK